MNSDQHFAEPPAALPSLGECSFYHCIDLPGLGVQRGQWDLRPGIDDYLGHFDFSGASVLEIGTASGFVCFELERRGARVTAFDLDENLTYDMFPGPTAERDPARFRAGLRKTRAAYWLGHSLLGSKAEVVYGHANRLPDFLRDFDVVMLGNVLQHLQDPMGALIGAAQRAQVVIVTESDWKRGLCNDVPAMLWLEDTAPYSWYQVKPRMVESVLSALGFQSTSVSFHEQLLLKDVTFEPGGALQARTWGDGRQIPHFTVIGRR
jgi:SAM-dependent methyltransferase